MHYALNAKSASYLWTYYQEGGFQHCDVYSVLRVSVCLWAVHLLHARMACMDWGFHDRHILELWHPPGESTMSAFGTELCNFLVT